MKERSKRIRGNGDGTVFLVPNRRHPWAAQVVVGWTPEGRPVRRARYAATKEEAERLLEQMRNGHVPPYRQKRKLVPAGLMRVKTEPSRHKRNVSPRVRYLIFERDNFTCRYCGASAPDVQLVVDHVIAHSKDGANDPANYVTACFECNAGKSNL